MALGNLLRRLVCECRLTVPSLMSISQSAHSPPSSGKNEVKTKGMANAIEEAGLRRADWGRRIQEFSLALRQTFEEAVQTQLSPRSQIDISVLVLEQDGGVLQTAINAVTLALVDAGIPMNDYICATSAGLVDNKAILGIPIDL
jgi:ribonuclease PH